MLVVKVNLNEKKFLPEWKYYERVKNRLKEGLKSTFDVIVSWESPEEKICPSSVASWFNDRGYKVSVCHQQYIHRPSNDIYFPILDGLVDGNNLESQSSLSNFYTWFGFLSIGCDLNSDDLRNLPFWPKDMNQKIGHVQYIQSTGFLTSERIKNIIEYIKKYVQTRKDLPWCCIDVHGFMDSPVSSNLKNRSFFLPSSDNFTILFHPELNKMIIRHTECTVKTKTKNKNK